MDDITTIKLSSTNLNGEHSEFLYSFNWFLMGCELAEYSALFSELFQYTPDEIREAIRFYDEHKYDGFGINDESESHTRSRSTNGINQGDSRVEVNYRVGEQQKA